MKIITWIASLVLALSIFAAIYIVPYYFGDSPLSWAVRALSLLVGILSILYAWKKHSA